jgi:hypothetical protein
MIHSFGGFGGTPDGGCSLTWPRNTHKNGDNSMALEHDLAIATDLPLTEVAAALLGAGDGVFDASVDGDALVSVDGVATKRGTWVRVLGMTAQVWHPIVAELGFTPRARVAFVLDKHPDHGHDLTEQQDDVFRVVLGLLERIPGDAVLHREYEQIELLRKDGVLHRETRAFSAE